MIGAIVDQFKITQAIENKIVYEVFVAQHIQTGSLFELHAINPDLTMNDSFSESLKNEIAQLINLEHPTILTPLNILDVDERLYVVYPREEGQSLLQLLEQTKGQFSLDGLMRIFKDILRGIGYAHSQGFHHRALNLEAIRVNADGDAKLQGFGRVLFNALQKQLGKDEMIGFARYYAPERFSNPETEDIRGNIYALGAMIYQMSTGKLPVDGDSPFRLEMVHADPDNKPAPAGSLRPDLPSGFSEMLQTALAKKPENRFQNPIEFFKEIEKIESKRKSELFADDFTKGFGHVENESFSISGDDLDDASASFKIEDPFADTGFDLGLESSIDTQKSTDQFDLDKTVKDSSFDPEQLSAFGLGSAPQPKNSLEEALAFPSPDAPDGMPANSPDPFSTFGVEEDPFNGLESELPSESNPFVSSPESPASTDFSFDLPQESPHNFEEQAAPDPSFDFNVGAAEPESAANSEIDSDFTQSEEAPMEIERNSDYTGSPDSGFSSDDGAFHFTSSSSSMSDDNYDGTIALDIPNDLATSASTEGPTAMPSVRRAEHNLNTSLKAASRPLMAKSLKKKNHLVPIIAVVSILAVLGLAWFVFTGHKKNLAYQERITEIKSLMNQRKYNDAQRAVEEAFNSEFSSSQKSELDKFRVSIENTVAADNKQIGSLFEKARNFETRGQRLVDGEKDAFSVYKKILKINPENSQAGQDMLRIRDLELGQTDQMIADGFSVAALQKLRILNQNYTDEGIREKYQTLLLQLQQTRGLELERDLTNTYNNNKYDQLPSIMEELRHIDPDSDFVKEKSVEMSKAFIKMGGEYQDKKDYEQAESYYILAMALNPKNKKIKGKIEAVQENANMLRIERAEDALDNALNAGDLKAQLDSANFLAELDPGNVKSNNALIEIKEKLLIKRADADRLRALGRFKEAARKYKDLYTVTGHTDVKNLWQQYRSWAPPAGMIYIPGGRFKIGYSPDFVSRPAHFVNLSSFFVDKYEITNAQFKAFVDANPKWAPGRIAKHLHNGKYLAHWLNGKPRPGTENEPVTYVSYFAAKAYAASKGKRLLTEAEWEVAAAGGTVNQKYWWGKSSSATQAAYNKFSKRRPASIGTFPANEYGVYEILGNVSEWVLDRYDERFYMDSKNAQDPLCKDGTLNIHRGGSFRHLGREITIYHRFLEEPEECISFIGFRCGKKANK